MAAAYTGGIVRNHPFVDGNKRTGFVVGILFLELHGYRFRACPSPARDAFWIGDSGRNTKPCSRFACDAPFLRAAGLVNLEQNAETALKKMKKMMCCEIGAMKVRLSYHADQSFHEGTSRSSRATSAPP
jgi:hypothetical protein